MVEICVLMSAEELAFGRGGDVIELILFVYTFVYFRVQFRNLATVSWPFVFGKKNIVKVFSFYKAQLYEFLQLPE